MVDDVKVLPNGALVAVNAVEALPDGVRVDGAVEAGFFGMSHFRLLATFLNQDLKHSAFRKKFVLTFPKSYI